MANTVGVPQWVSAVFRLADSVGRIAICKVEVKVTKQGAFGYNAPKNFAYVRGRESGTAIKIDTKKEWADKAGVSNTASHQRDNGWWGEPDVAWFVPLNDKRKLSEMGGILAKIQKARHR